MTTDNDNSKACKIVLVGDAGTGKTCIISRFVNNHFEKSQMTTACPSFCTKSVTYPEYNKTINLDIWDTAGQEIYRAISKLFYKGASVGVLVFDITNKKTFNSVKEYWYNQLKENTDDNISFTLVGNKIDLFEEEEIKEDEAIEFAKSINAEFYLTSAKKNVGISDIFLNAGKKFIDPNFSLDKNDENNNKGRNVRIKTINKKEIAKENNACC